MRRNRFFAIEDLIMLHKIKEEVLRLYIKQLSDAGYVQCVTSKAKFRDASYKLTKNTGVIAPQWIAAQKKLIDINLASKNIDATMKLPVCDNSQTKSQPTSNQAYAQGRVLRVLMDEKDGIGLNALRNQCGLSPATFNSTIDEMINDKIIECENCVYRLIP